VIDSKVEMIKCEISEGKMDGINVHSGHLEIQECKIQGNKNNGLLIKRSNYLRDQCCAYSAYENKIGKLDV